MNLERRARKALTARFRELYPNAAMEREDFVSSPELNLMDIRWIRKNNLEKIFDDLRAGDGKELERESRKPPKFNAIHSSAALVVNSFGPWLREPGSLQLLDTGNFQSISFEKKLQVTPKGKAANLDVFASGFEGIVAIESKFLEPLKKTFKDQPFSDAYRYFRNKPNCEVWYEQVKKINNYPDKFQYLDARQLTSHALGLIGSFGPYPIKLLYLYWEPANWSDFEAYTGHREEIEAFKAEVQGSTVQLEAMSYPELWDTWDLMPVNTWVKSHVEKLKNRYSIHIVI